MYVFIVKDTQVYYKLSVLIFNANDVNNVHIHIYYFIVKINIVMKLNWKGNDDVVKVNDMGKE